MPNRTAQYLRYRGSYARVKVNGQLIHLGVYNSPASKARYKELIAQWAADQPITPDDSDLGTAHARFAFAAPRTLSFLIPAAACRRIL
jgi:hypothetical protein